jgi:DNA-binding response OmpR family regulator
MVDPLPLHRRTILIVEDAYLVALEAQRVVEEAGAARVLLAATVDDVRSALAAEEGIDLCILDLKLGEEDAGPLIRDMLGRGIAVLVATGFDAKSLAIGAPVLRKPYQERELIDAIRVAIRPEMG